MPNPVYVMEAANLFCGSEATDDANSNHLVLEQLKLPGMQEQYVDHRPGGSPVSIEIDTIIQRPECTFVLLGWTTQVATLLASWQSGQNAFTAYGVVRDRTTGDAMQAMAQITGRLGIADPQNFRRGEAMTWNYAIRSIIHYGLWLADGTGPVSTNASPQDAIWYWDFPTNTFLVGGQDPTAGADNPANTLNALLHTGTTPVVTQ